MDALELQRERFKAMTPHSGGKRRIDSTGRHDDSKRRTSSICIQTGTTRVSKMRSDWRLRDMQETDLFLLFISRFDALNVRYRLQLEAERALL